MTLSPLILEARSVAKVIEFNSLSLSILKNVNLDVKAADCIAILGSSGSGKSTLLSLLAGMDLPTQGTVQLLGTELQRLTDRDKALLRLKTLGFIFQSFKLIPSLNAIENVMLPMELAYLPIKIAKNHALEWLKKVGLDQRVTHYPHQLSGGEQQRVAIARAFVMHPKIVFADEMTGNLDTETGREILDLIFSINHTEKTALIMVTHDQEIADRCHSQYILKEGTLVPC